MSVTTPGYSVVTGGTSGIGLALAEALAQRGDALLLVGDWLEEATDAVACPATHHAGLFRLAATVRAEAAERAV